jgi:hypothetical protein
MKHVKQRNVRKKHVKQHEKISAKNMAKINLKKCPQNNTSNHTPKKMARRVKPMWTDHKTMKLKQ